MKQNHLLSRALIDEGGFPRLYAAASLKRLSMSALYSRARQRFSAALCRGLIEATPADQTRPLSANGFPRLYAAASLKLRVVVAGEPPGACGFPRLYAAASLKRLNVRVLSAVSAWFSAALCRGLIEAIARQR